MVKVSYQQKPYRKSMMKVWGAEVHSSPSEETEIGRRILSESPDNPGSLGIAISEAIEVAVKDEKAHYSLGSVLNHVLLHQTIIGEEAIKQMEIAGDYPDVVIGCVGGGSNFAGIVFPFIREKLKGKEIEAIAVEPTSCPTLTKGEYLYDFGDTGKMTGNEGIFSSCIVATRSKKRDIAMIYTAGSKNITVKMHLLKGPRVFVYWFNPRTGKWKYRNKEVDKPIPDEKPPARTGEKALDYQFYIPGIHTISNDWVLILSNKKIKE